MTDSTAAFIGSPVKLAGDSDAKGGAPTVSVAADSDKPVGVIVAIDQWTGVSSPSYERYHRPASIDMYVWVVDDPEALFVAQADDAMTSADMGLNCGWVAESGSTTTGLSTVEIDTSDKATTSTLPLRLEKLYQIPGNVFGANQKVVVSFNKHAYKTGYDTGATAEIGGLGV
jgi:hypothetical protein